MRIAYIISAYKNPDQLVRLIGRLHAENASIFVHIDKRATSEIYTQVVEGTQHLPGLYFLKRHRCEWGGFGHVQATLEGINAILARRIPFDYAILLTGQDYPIKSPALITEFLRKNQGKSFIDYFPLPSDNWAQGGLPRIERWHLHFARRHVAFPANGTGRIKRRFPRGFSPFGGSSYWCLARECIEYVHAFARREPGFVRYFKTVDVPDEMFFQTILLNSACAEDIVNDDLHYIEWKDPGSGSPSILGRGDFDMMAASPKLFARKFDVDVDAEVLDWIDQRLLVGACER
jgi:hypothetical protein